MKKFIGLLSMFVACMSVYAQSDNDVLLYVGNEKITKQEFVKMYEKNNPSNSGNLDIADMESYLDLYINYKLKLLQAKDLGLDTTKNYLDEVRKYRRQIVEPYINDRTITDSLIQEAYEREFEFVRASHILITIPANASPEDTLALYNKAMMIRNKALKGEDFAALAIQYSDDPSVKGNAANGNDASMGNAGDLGYFTSMVMIYPFENACYNLQKGEISMPVRTNFGYHIIKLTDRIPADFQSVDIKHVMIKTDNRSDEEAQELIQHAWNLVPQLGIDSVAKAYSEDTYSAQKNGWMIHQRCNNLPPEFIAMMQNMKEDELSPVFKTRYGWHFFRLTKRYAVPSLEVEKQSITQRIAKDQRAYKSIESFIEKAKVEYGCKLYPENLKEICDVLTDSIFSASWQMPENFSGEKIVCSVGDTSFSQQQLLEELYQSQRKQTPEYIPVFVEKYLKNFADNKTFEYADARLEEKYLEFHESMQSFRDGILIFSITDRKVWNKSLEDTIGLQQFYELNKDKYVWKYRADATMWTITKKWNLKKVEKLIKKYTKKGLTNNEILDLLVKKYKVEDSPNKSVYYTWNRYEKGANHNIDALVWNTSLSEDMNATNIYVTDTNLVGNKNVILVLKKFDSPKQKELSECKGIVTSQYQEFLEQQWIKELREQYPYKVDKDVFNSLKK